MPALKGSARDLLWWHDRARGEGSIGAGGERRTAARERSDEIYRAPRAVPAEPGVREQGYRLRWAYIGLAPWVGSGFVSMTRIDSMRRALAAADQAGDDGE